MQQSQRTGVVLHAACDHGLRLESRAQPGGVASLLLGPAPVAEDEGVRGGGSIGCAQRRVRVGIAAKALQARVCSRKRRRNNKLV
ncbi:hypothetical protein [Granulicella arctica]|uniref:hypothetical protein n=1 Tax=Granulicella arctica TaxID=940613 RepID=UPI0021E0D81C|nr:hypothetical protein [Granulicella arctica]